eukprot:9694606-Lingulodinium_polyedra.AAC.1
MDRLSPAGVAGPRGESGGSSAPSPNGQPHWPDGPPRPLPPRRGSPAEFSRASATHRCHPSG